VSSLLTYVEDFCSDSDDLAPQRFSLEATAVAVAAVGLYRVCSILNMLDQDQSQGDDTRYHTEVRCKPSNLFHDAHSLLVIFLSIWIILILQNKIKWIS